MTALHLPGGGARGAHGLARPPLASTSAPRAIPADIEAGLPVVADGVDVQRREELVARALAAGAPGPEVPEEVRDQVPPELAAAAVPDRVPGRPGGARPGISAHPRHHLKRSQAPPHFRD